MNETARTEKSEGAPANVETPASETKKTPAAPKAESKPVAPSEAKKEPPTQTTRSTSATSPPKSAAPKPTPPKPTSTTSSTKPSSTSSTEKPTSSTSTAKPISTATPPKPEAAQSPPKPTSDPTPAKPAAKPASQNPASLLNSENPASAAPPKPAPSNPAPPKPTPAKPAPPPVAAAPPLEKVDKEKVFAGIIKPYGPSLLKMVDKVKSKDNIQSFEVKSFQELLVPLKDAPAGIILQHLSNQQHLIAAFTMLKQLKGLLKQGRIKVLFTTFLKQPMIATKLQQEGAADVLVEPVKEKPFDFKVNRYIQAMDQMRKRLVQKDEMNRKSLDAKKKGGAGKEEDKVELVAPLKFQSDCWLMKGGSARKIMGRWMITLKGPGPQCGKWEEVPSTGSEQHWKWNPKNQEEYPFITDEGEWIFRGHRPEFRGDLWSFVGKNPDLSFMNKEENLGSKFSLNKEKGSLKVARDSKPALEKLPLIVKSLEIQVNLKEGEEGDEDGEDKDREDGEGGSKKKDWNKKKGKDGEEEDDEDKPGLGLKRLKSDEAEDELRDKMKKKKEGEEEEEEGLGIKKLGKDGEETEEELKKKGLKGEDDKGTDLDYKGEKDKEGEGTKDFVDKDSEKKGEGKDFVDSEDEKGPGLKDKRIEGEEGKGTELDFKGEKEKEGEKGKTYVDKDGVKRDQYGNEITEDEKSDGPKDRRGKDGEKSGELNDNLSEEDDDPDAGPNDFVTDAKGNRVRRKDLPDSDPRKRTPPKDEISPEEAEEIANKRNFDLKNVPDNRKRGKKLTPEEKKKGPFGDVKKSKFGKKINDKTGDDKPKDSDVYSIPVEDFGTPGGKWDFVYDDDEHGKVFVYVPLEVIEKKIQSEQELKDQIKEFYGYFGPKPPTLSEDQSQWIFYKNPPQDFPSLDEMPEPLATYLVELCKGLFDRLEEDEEIGEDGKRRLKPGARRNQANRQGGFGKKGHAGLKKRNREKEEKERKKREREKQEAKKKKKRGFEKGEDGLTKGQRKAKEFADKIKEKLKEKGELDEDAEDAIDKLKDDLGKAKIVDEEGGFEDDAGKAILEDEEGLEDEDGKAKLEEEEGREEDDDGKAKSEDGKGQGEDESGSGDGSDDGKAKLGEDDTDLSEEEKKKRAEEDGHAEGSEDKKDGDSEDTGKAEGSDSESGEGASQDGEAGSEEEGGQKGEGKKEGEEEGADGSSDEAKSASDEESGAEGEGKSKAEGEAEAGSEEEGKAGEGGGSEGQGEGSGEGGAESSSGEDGADDTPEHDEDSKNIFDEGIEAGTPAEPSLNPLALAFLTSELMLCKKLEYSEMTKRFCEYVSSACGSVRIEMWSFRAGEWTCIGTSDGEPGKETEAVSKIQSDMYQQGEHCVAATMEKNERVGALVFTDKRAGEINGDFAFAASQMAKGFILGAGEAKPQNETAESKEPKDEAA